MIITVEERRPETPGGTINVRYAGSGRPTLLFVHGLLVNGHVWDPLLAPLSERFRLVLPDLPLGGHSVPLEVSADCSLAAHADRVLALARQLQPPVVLVGSDTGGAIAQLAVTRDPELFARLILLPSDAFTNCPPTLLAPMRYLAHVPGAISLIALTLHSEPIMRLMMKLVSQRHHERKFLDSLVGELRSSSGVQRDLAKLLMNLQPAVTSAAARELHRFTGPVLVIWTERDPLFPRGHAERLAGCFPDASVSIARDSRAFVSLDAPDFLVNRIIEFVETSSAHS